MWADRSRPCTCAEVVSRHPMCRCDRKHFNDIVWALVTVFQVPLFPPLTPENTVYALSIHEHKVSYHPPHLYPFIYAALCLCLHLYLSLSIFILCICLCLQSVHLYLRPYLYLYLYLCSISLCLLYSIYRTPARVRPRTCYIALR